MPLSERGEAEPSKNALVPVVVPLRRAPLLCLGGLQGGPFLVQLMAAADRRPATNHKEAHLAYLIIDDNCMITRICRFHSLA